MTRKNPAPRTRVVTVSLTPSGHELVELLVDRVLGREADLVSRLTSDQQTTLTDLLRQLLADLNDQIGPQAPSQVGSPAIGPSVP